MLEEFRMWAETYRKPYVQSVTFLKYEQSMQWIEELFGDRSVDEIKKIDLQKAFNTVSTKYQKLTIKAFYQQLLAFYQSLVDDGEIERNIMKGIRYSGIERKKKKKWLEAEDANKLADALDHTQTYDMMIYTALKTGMRYAEVLGVTKNDLYEKSGLHMLSINKSMDHKCSGEFKTTKTVSSVREISIDSTLYHDLLNFAEKNHRKDDESIFGRKFSASVNRKLEVLCEKNGIEPISFHGLRHTHGSLLLMQGVPILSVSKRLGHATTTITQDIYIHLMEKQENEDNENIAKLMEAT